MLIREGEFIERGLNSAFKVSPDCSSVQTQTSLARAVQPRLNLMHFAPAENHVKYFRCTYLSKLADAHSKIQNHRT